MKKKSLSRFMAFAMAGMMLCAPLSVSAADPTTEVTEVDDAKGTVTGEGKVEDVVDKSIFKVELPTETEDPAKSIFKFILDPQGLIMDTEAAAHDGAEFDGSGFYFTNITKDEADKDVTSYSCTSDSLTATNKGTVAVDVELVATATLTDIKLSDDPEFEKSPTDASVYLELVSGEEYVALSGDAATATLKTSLDPALEGAYAVTYDTTNSAYKYELTDDAKTNPNDYFYSLDFNLFGLCNTAADWTAVKSEEPSVTVAWTLTQHED